ncbi:MAG: hypothetical protein ABR548_15730 [Actinomycetota bacterium]|nr:hypothetical protein [Actinomycetota bacterium]
MHKPTGRTLIVQAAFLGVVSLIAPGCTAHEQPVSAKSGPTQSPHGSCIEAPARAATPPWYPKDLPLPAGSYATDLKGGGPVPGFRQIVFSVPLNLREFVENSRNEWTRSGWIFGTGEAEPGEAENRFSKPGTDRSGAFRANSSLCDTRRVLLYIIVGNGFVPTPARS